MTCRRLEDDLLGDLGDALDPHVEQCPDCSARAQGYRRIAGWIADGRTTHRPPAEWRHRTLARALSGTGQLRSIPPPPTEPEPAAGIDAATVQAGRPPGTTLSESAGARRQVPPSRSPRRWVRAALPIASAAIIIAVAVAVVRGGDPQPPRVALDEQRTTSDRGALPPTDDAGIAAVPRAPAHDVHDTAPAEPSGPPSKPPAADDSPRAGKPPASTRHPADSPQPQKPPVHSTKRGGDVIVDWGDEPGAVHVALGPPTGDLGGLTADEIQRVIEAQVGLFRACYQNELSHTPAARGTLVLQIEIGGDGQVQAASSPASSASTLHNEAVAQCAISHVQRLRFPAKDRTASVTYAFEFTQEGRER